jgi:hypothetical protein
MPAYDGDLFTPPAPVARVSLRRSGTAVAVQDVLMLLDSGADVTPIPKTPVGTIGAPVNSGPGYELMGFDGTKSVAQSAELDLVFLNRAFTGRFLLIDQAWGIIGRDVLIHIAVLLDGPKSIWSEQAP